MLISGQLVELNHKTRRINGFYKKKIFGTGIEFYSNYNAIQRDLDLKSDLVRRTSTQIAAENENIGTSEISKKNLFRSSLTQYQFIFVDVDPCRFLDEARELMFEIDRDRTIGVYKLDDECVVLIHSNGDEIMMLASVINVGNDQQVFKLVEEGQLLDIFFECVWDVLSFVSGNDNADDDIQLDRIENIRILLSEMMKQ